MAVTVALAFAPELVLTVANVRAARRLRGRPVRGVAGLRGMAVPVLEGALDRSLQLASSMDARGYGRRNALTGPTAGPAAALVAAGLLVVVVGLYGVLDSGASAPSGSRSSPWGWPSCAASLLLGGRRSSRTRYRPDPWRWPEWAGPVLRAGGGSGIARPRRWGVAGIQYSATPLAVPLLPLSRRRRSWSAWSPRSPRSTLACHLRSPAASAPQRAGAHRPGVPRRPDVRSPAACRRAGG